MTSFTRKLVSKNKRRFVSDKEKGGFDLDLTYITDNLIAMGFPSENIEGVYRNPMSEVVRFLETRHHDKYRIYNLCSERSYDVAKFHGRVGLYPFDDHNAPTIELVKNFCDDVHSWLSIPENVAVIHCKAGKGRTGVMICCYLLHSRMWKEAQDALQFYGAYRTSNSKGVTIPSQIRYVHYYAELLNKGSEYKPVTVLMKKMTLVTIPKFNSSGYCSPFFILNKGNTKIFTSKDIEVNKDAHEIEIPMNFPLCGDIRIEFYHKEKFKKPSKMFHFWFNTFFTKEKVIFKKSELDKANKDKKHSNFEENFQVVLEFDIIEGETISMTASGADESLKRSSHFEDTYLDLGTDEEDLSDDESIVSDEDKTVQSGSVEMA